MPSFAREDMARNARKTAPPAPPAPNASGGRLAELKNELGLMNIELTIYREIGALVAQRSPRSSILSRLMDFTLKALDCDSGTLYLLDRDTRELSFAVVKGPLKQKLKGMRMRSDKGIAGLVAKTGRPHLSTDLKRDKAWLGIKEESLRNMAAVPLKVNRDVIGVIEVINKEKGSPFTKKDLKVLASLSNHFSIIMQSAALFSELDGRVRQFSTLHEVGNLLISSLDQRVVRKRTMEAITKLMMAETGSLLLVDEERKELYFEVALGEKGKVLKEVRLGMGEGIAGWVAKHGKSVIIRDVTKDRRFEQRFDEKSKFKTRNMVCVPVRIKGRIIGVIQAINRLGGGSFTGEDLLLFELFSNQVAIALDNARLYEEIKETFYATSGALAEAIEKRDPYTGGHTKRVLEYSLAAARYLNLAPEATEILKLSAVLHDIGKIGIEDKILRKGAPLDEGEAATMRMHPELGVEILKHVPQLKDVVPGMLYHHERVDGRGYPTGFRDGQIPLIAKVISVADTYDAMTTTRPYRKGLSPEAAIREIKRFSGTQFDEEIVAAFLKAFKEGDIEAIAKEPLPEHLSPGKGGAPSRRGLDY